MMNIETQQVFETAEKIYKDKDFQTVREILEELLRSDSK
jgi:ribosomal protein S17E